MKKFIILLSAKRTGSTAVLKIFQKHKETSIFNQNQKIDNWESQYWSLASKAINGDTREFTERLKVSFPKVNVPKSFTENSIFELHDSILNLFSTHVFDKSPQYLGNEKCLDLLIKYSKSRGNVKFLSLIRNPLDAISSQHELWKNYTNEKNLELREDKWLKQYKHLDFLINNGLKIKKIYYEKLVESPSHEVESIFKYLEIKHDENSIKHLKKISVGRYQAAILKEIKSWKWSKEFDDHLKQNFYHPDQFVIISKLEKFKIWISSLKRYIPISIKRLLRK